MRALLMTEPSRTTDRTVVTEIPEPRPGPGEITIDVAYAGINFVDVMERRGDAGYVRTWPHAAGHEVAGTVREIGPGIDGVAVGQRVAAYVASGGLAEVATAKAALTVPVPDEVALPVAAASPLLLASTLLLLTDAARFRPGDSVLVHSASGGVGSAVAQLVPVLGGGLRIGTVGRADKVPAARASGYDVVAERADNLPAAVRSATADGVDVVLDALGTSMLDVDLEIVAPGGRIVLFGNASGETVEPLPPAGRLIGGNISISGFSMSSLTRSAPRRVAAALRRILDLIADGRLEFAVTEIALLDDVAAVHQALADGRGKGKYVARVAAA